MINLLKGPKLQTVLFLAVCLPRGVRCLWKGKPHGISVPFSSLWACPTLCLMILRDRTTFKKLGEFWVKKNTYWGVWNYKLPLCRTPSLYLRDKELWSGFSNTIKWQSVLPDKLFFILVKRESGSFNDTLHDCFVLPAPLLKNNTWNIPFITAEKVTTLQAAAADEMAWWKKCLLAFF